MEVKRKFRTEKLKFPVDGYKYNVQVDTETVTITLKRVEE